MRKQALFFRAGDSQNLGALMECCRDEEFEVEDRGEVPDPEALRALLSSTPLVLFFPVVEEDCLSVKLTQDALMEMDRPPCVIVLCATSLPSKEFLCLAFREGVDDVISLGSDRNALAMQVKRADRLLRKRLKTFGAGGELRGKNRALQQRCERLESLNAKWQERLQALAATASRISTGEWSVARAAPHLLIVASSASQASSAADLARRLGFEPQIVPNGKDALQAIGQRPPTLILTDGTLPDMDASGLALAARKALGDKPVVIVAWSSNPEVEEKLLAPDTGIDDFVLKSRASQATGLLAAALLGGLR